MCVELVGIVVLSLAFDLVRSRGGAVDGRVFAHTPVRTYEIRKRMLLTQRGKVKSSFVRESGWSGSAYFVSDFDVNGRRLDTMILRLFSGIP